MTSGEVEITRIAEGWRDRARAYKVYVNGQRRDEIGRGETRVLEVEPGEAEIYLKIDWCRSRRVKVAVAPGAKVRLSCGPRGLLTGLYDITFGWRNYMWLQEGQA